MYDWGAGGIKKKLWNMDLPILAKVWRWTLNLQFDLPYSCEWQTWVESDWSDKPSVIVDGQSFSDCEIWTKTQQSGYFVPYFLSFSWYRPSQHSHVNGNIGYKVLEVVQTLACYWLGQCSVLLWFGTSSILLLDVIFFCCRSAFYAVNIFFLVCTNSACVNVCVCVHVRVRVRVWWGWKSIQYLLFANLIIFWVAVQ